MHTLYFLFFLRTTTMLANQFAYWTSLMLLLASNFFTTTFMIWFLLGANFLFLYLTSFAPHLTFSLWVMMDSSIPVMYELDHTKLFILAFKKATNPVLIKESRQLLKILSSLVDHHLTSSNWSVVGPSWILDPSFFNFYNSSTFPFIVLK